MPKVSIPNTLKKFNALEDDLSTTIASALWKKAAALQEYLNASVPIGKIIWFRATQDFLPEALPDSKYWKELDGTVVDNPNSVFDGWTTPDLVGVFLKHPSDLETNQVVSGSDTRNLSHSHGGATQPRKDTGGEIKGALGGGRYIPTTHTHSLATWANTLDVTPPYRDLRFFMRIA